jgi:hypothetical protein
MVELAIPQYPPIKAWNHSVKPGVVNREGVRMWTMKEHRCLSQLIEEYPKATLVQLINQIVPKNMNVSPTEVEQYLKVIEAIPQTLKIAKELRKVSNGKSSFHRIDIVMDPSVSSRTGRGLPPLPERQGPDGLLPSERIVLCKRVFDVMKHSRLPERMTSSTVKSLWEAGRWGLYRNRSNEGPSYEDLCRHLERELDEDAYRILNCLKCLETYRLRMLAWLLNDSLKCLWCCELYSDTNGFENHVMADHTEEFAKLEEYLIGSSENEKLIEIIDSKVISEKASKYKVNSSDEVLSSVDPAPRGEYLLNRGFTINIQNRPSGDSSSSSDTSSGSDTSSDGSSDSDTSSSDTGSDSDSSDDRSVDPGSSHSSSSTDVVIPGNSWHESSDDASSTDVIDTPFFAQKK